MKLTFIQTGGTIDKDYPHTTQGWAFEIHDPAFERILASLDPSFEYECFTACKKDSMEITDEDREQIVALVNGTETGGVIVTHGTDTLVETAQYLADRVAGKTVVFTGAMRPERFSNSDAPINLGCAIGAAQTLESGVYVAMHGVVKSAADIRRDMETGKFE